MAILVEEENTFVCQRSRSTTNTRTDINRTHTFMALNMKSVGSIHLKTAYMITTPHVQYVTSAHVQPSWWYPLGMIAPPLGPKSTMGTWCRSATTTNSLATSFALTETRSLFTAAVQTSMVPFCTLWKVSVARCHAYLMLVVGNWLALYAPSDESTVEKLFRH